MINSTNPIYQLVFCKYDNIKCMKLDQSGFTTVFRKNNFKSIILYIKRSFQFFLFLNVDV